MPDNKDRSRRVLEALKALRGKDAPTLGDEPEDEEDPESDGLEPEPPVPIFAPGESETQRKLKRAKVRKSVDDEMQALWPEPPKA